MLMVAGESHSVEKRAGFGIGIDIVCVSNLIAVLLHVSAGFKGDLVITVKHYSIAFIGANDDVACFKITCINHVSIIVGSSTCRLGRGLGYGHFGRGLFGCGLLGGVIRTGEGDGFCVMVCRFNVKSVCYCAVDEGHIISVHPVSETQNVFVISTDVEITGRHNSVILIAS